MKKKYRLDPHSFFFSVLILTLLSKKMCSSSASAIRDPAVTWTLCSMVLAGTGVAVWVELILLSETIPVCGSVNSATDCGRFPDYSRDYELLDAGWKPQTPVRALTFTEALQSVTVIDQVVWKTHPNQSVFIPSARLVNVIHSVLDVCATRVGRVRRSPLHSGLFHGIIELIAVAASIGACWALQKLGPHDDGRQDPLSERSLAMLMAIIAVFATTIITYEIAIRIPIDLDSVGDTPRLPPCVPLPEDDRANCAMYYPVDGLGSVQTFARRSLFLYDVAIQSETVGYGEQILYPIVFFCAFCAYVRFSRRIVSFHIQQRASGYTQTGSVDSMGSADPISNVNSIRNPDAISLD